jgi:hypothetical protein
MICERNLVVAVGSDRIAVECNVEIVSRIRIGMFWGREGVMKALKGLYGKTRSGW